MKKTLAVLLDNIMLRLGRLESKVDNIFNGTGGNLTNGTSTATPGSSNAEKVNVAGKAHNSTRCVYGHALLLYTIKQKWLHVSKKRYFFFLELDLNPFFYIFSQNFSSCILNYRDFSTPLALISPDSEAEKSSFAPLCNHLLQE